MLDAAFPTSQPPAEESLLMHTVPGYIVDMQQELADLRERVKLIEQGSFDTLRVLDNALGLIRDLKPVMLRAAEEVGSLYDRVLTLEQQINNRVSEAGLAAPPDPDGTTPAPRE
jgi:hypothetical protein